MTEFNVTGFGALGDGIHDDRPAIQAAITTAAASGGYVFFPPGRYLVSRAGTAYYCLLAVGPVRLYGPEATLVQAPCGPSVRLLNVTGADVVVDGLTLDGDKAHQTVDEHRAGIFADGADRLYLHDVKARNFTGDGFYLYRATDTLMVLCEATDNGRNGMTLGGTVTGVRIGRCEFLRNKAQQFDSEPGGDWIVSGVSLTECTLDAQGVSGDYALTISGSATATPGHDWEVTDCEIGGGVFVVWAERVLIGWCRTGDVLVQRSSKSVDIVGCRTGKVRIEGTAGSGPADVFVSGCRVTGGVEVRGAVSARIVGNRIEGPGERGVYVRDTVDGREVQASVTDNRISGFTTPIATAGAIPGLELARNIT